MPYVAPITNFVVAFLNDPNVRKLALFKEMTTMKTTYGLNDTQALMLCGLDKTTIADEIAKELKALPIQLWPKDPHPASEPWPPCDLINTPLSVAAYDEGKIYIRYNDPKVVKVNDSREFTLVGTGFDALPAVTFTRVKDENCQDVVAIAPTDGDVIEIRCEADAFQYVTVEATLPELGIYRIDANNDPNTPLPMGKVGWVKVVA